MASFTSQQRPVLCTFLYPPQFLSTTSRALRLGASSSITKTRGSLPSRRTFLTSPACRAGARDPQAQFAKEMSRHNSAARQEASMTLEAKRQQSKVLDSLGAQMDTGLLPGTLIVPPASTLPSFMSGARWRLEAHRAKQRAQELGSLVYYKWFMGLKGKNRPRLDRAGLADQAKRLHWDMWTAFAAGDRARIADICAAGLKDNLTKRMREGGYQWNLHAYQGRAKVVSDRAAQMGDLQGFAVRQAVVRIKSEQTMKKTMQTRIREDRGMGKRDTAGGVDDRAQAQEDIKMLDEYVVLQRVIWDKKESPWVVWGTTRPSDIQPILSGAAN